MEGFLIGIGYTLLSIFMGIEPFSGRWWAGLGLLVIVILLIGEVNNGTNTNQTP